MATPAINRKRKAVTRDVIEMSDSESDAGFVSAIKRGCLLIKCSTNLLQGNGLLEGILSGSETDSDGEAPEFDSEDNLEGTEDEEDQEDQEELAAINGSAALQIATIPTELDGDDNDKPNYIITKDANGGERYEYQEIGERLWA